MEITSALVLLVSGISLALALVTVSPHLWAVRKTDFDILKLKRDLNEASSRVYVPTFEEISELLDTIKISEQMSRNLDESAREHIAYYKTSAQQSSSLTPSEVADRWIKANTPSASSVNMASI